MSVYLDMDVLDALREAAIQSPKRLRRNLGMVARGNTAKELIKALSKEPPPPNYPYGKFPWKSDKQRRFVMAKLRRKGNLPYQRTHVLAQGWRVVLTSLGADDTKGVITAENSSRYARYVQGDDAQPFHVSRWPQAAPLIRQYSPDFQELVIDAWYRAVTP